MRIKVGQYQKEWMAHKCILDNGKVLLLDITVSGGLPKGINPEHLVGMEFDIEYHHPFLSIAAGVR